MVIMAFHAGRLLACFSFSFANQKTILHVLVMFAGYSIGRFDNIMLDLILKMYVGTHAPV